MKLETFQYRLASGWSVKNFPDLNSSQTLVLLFASPSIIKDLTPIKEICNFYNASNIVGCTSAGEILNSNINDDSISVAVMKFENNDSEIKISKVKIASPEDSFNAGETLAKNFSADELKGIFVLSEGLNVNGSELVKGLNSIHTKIPISGGLAGDGALFKETWTIYNGEALQNNVVAVALYGKDVMIGHGSRGGWDIFGPERLITRAKNNILYELDNQPALTLYKEYLGEKAKGLPATGLFYPLAIRKNETEKHQIVRTILAIDETKNALIFAGDTPQGYLAQLMRANFDRLIDGAIEAASLANTMSDESSEDPMLSIAISCVGRRLVLGERAEEETESALEMLPKNCKQVGFYSYGEISPYIDNQTCDLHNQTMTLTTIYEKI